ncbi:MAG: SDR family oxidoreductase [Planctomycetes bacterium]|nr:SDR family oxidoreductase [Planctomycetota bacterium]
MKLDEVKAIVTGAGSGMGRAFALGLASAGAQVVVADVSMDGIRETLDEGAGLPGKLFPCEADVSSEESVRAMIERAAADMGGLNALVNNAGIFRDGLLVKVDKQTGKVSGAMSLENWNKVLAVDLTGPFLCTREFARQVIDSGTKSSVVINISSVSRAGNRGQSNYSAAKAGLVADTKLWAEELARYGIRVGAVAPGFIQTPILDGMRPDMLEAMVSQVPLRRTGTPHEIFQGVKFILECDYFTGRCLDIDGGLHV